MNLETLEKDRLQALRKECHSEPQILVERLLHEVVTLWQVAMENEIEAFRVDRDLMRDLFLLVVQEVLQELLFLLLVISLAHEAMPSADFVVTEDRPLHNLLQHELVLLVSHLVVDLPQSKSGQQRVQHLVAPSLEHLSEFALGPFLQAVKNVKEARVDARLQAMQLYLLALDLDIAMQGRKVGPEELHTAAEATNDAGGAGVHALHLLGDPIGRKHSH